MYRIPLGLDLSSLVGEFTTQLMVGQFDLQFTFGAVHFAVQSPVRLYRGRERVARWEEGSWPEPGFYDVMNAVVTRCGVVTDRLIVFEFDNGLEMHLEDDSGQYETMQITLLGDSSRLIV